jgi:putative addiction module component (TIGR02574 family)
MSATFQQIEQEVMALSAAERAQLVDKLWDSLGDSDYPALSESWLREIERRRRDLAEGKAGSVAGEEVSRRAWNLAEGSDR